MVNIVPNAKIIHIGQKNKNCAEAVILIKHIVNSIKNVNA